MKDLKQRISELEQLSIGLEPGESERNDYQSLIKDFANKFIGNLDETKSYSDSTVRKELITVDGSKKSLQEVLEIYSSEVAGKGIKAASGGHLGYIPGGGLYSSAIADFLADITNEYAGIYFSSPGGVTIENELLNWLKSIFNFPESAVGNLTSGGSIATLIAFTAARDRHKIKSAKIPNSVIYLSEQVHHCVNKALRIIGLEDIVIRHIELDEYSRLDAEKLRTQIQQDKENGLNPFLVVASAGTTDTGAIDPIGQIGISLEKITCGITLMQLMEVFLSWLKRKKNGLMA